MKIFIKPLYILALIFCFMLFMGPFSRIFAQGPPPLPPSPHQVPWENFIITAGVCVGYGVLKIFRKNKK